MRRHSSAFSAKGGAAGIVIAAAAVIDPKAHIKS
jgi:hypothetical protein